MENEGKAVHNHFLGYRNDFSAFYIAGLIRNDHVQWRLIKLIESGSLDLNAWRGPDNQPVAGRMTLLTEIVWHATTSGHWLDLVSSVLLHGGLPHNNAESYEWWSATFESVDIPKDSDDMIKPLFNPGKQCIFVPRFSMPDVTKSSKYWSLGQWSKAEYLHELFRRLRIVYECHHQRILVAFPTPARTVYANYIAPIVQCMVDECPGYVLDKLNKAKKDIPMARSEELDYCTAMNQAFWGGRSVGWVL